MSFNNNKQHSRRLKDPTNPSRNQKLTRRRDTSLPMSNNELCQFKIQISYDDLGFFVINARGNLHLHSFLACQDNKKIGWIDLPQF